VIRVYDGAGKYDRNARARGRFQRAETLLVTARHEPEAELGVDKFGCAWTLCSTRSGCGWPQRSQLQPGVPSLACCVTLLPATFWNLGLGDPLSSCNKRIVFISYSFFAWQIRIRRARKTSRGLAFALRKSLRPKPNRDHLKLLLDAEREDVVLSLRLIVNYRARPDDRRVT
jgi:hypothetical protein